MNKILMFLKEKYKEYSRKLYIWKNFHSDIQLDVIRSEIEQDLRWLAEDKVACLILERYKDMCSKDWYSKVIEPQSKVRENLRKIKGVDIHTGK